MEWITKKRTRYHRGGVDVYVSVCKGDSVHKNAVIICVKNGKMLDITSTEYAVFGFDGNRIYFKEADSYYGYKAVVQTKNPNILPSFSLKTVDEYAVDKAKDFVGSYILEYDEENKLYYIEKEA